MESEEKFLSQVEGQVRYRAWWLTAGLLFMAMGFYALIWNQSILLHMDSVLSNGGVKKALANAASERMSSSTRVIIEAAYEKFLPAAFAMFGSVSLGLGAFIVVYIRLQERWLSLLRSIRGNSGKAS